MALSSTNLGARGRGGRQEEQNEAAADESPSGAHGRRSRRGVPGRPARRWAPSCGCRGEGSAHDGAKVRGKLHTNLTGAGAQCCFRPPDKASPLRQRFQAVSYTTISSAPATLVVVEPDPVDRREAIRHRRELREPHGEDDEVIGAGALEIAQDTRLALAAVGDDSGCDQPDPMSTTSRRDT